MESEATDQRKYLYLKYINEFLELGNQRQSRRSEDTSQKIQMNC